eukprot:s5278_g3.t1
MRQLGLAGLDMLYVSMHRVTQHRGVEWNYVPHSRVLAEPCTAGSPAAVFAHFRTEADEKSFTVTGHVSSTLVCDDPSHNCLTFRTICE